MNNIPNGDKKYLQNIKIIPMILGVFVFRVLLDINYLVFINPNYSYSGFTADMDIGRFCYSYGLLVLCIPFIIANTKRFKLSNIIVLLLDIFAFISGTSLFAFKEPPEGMILLWTCYFLILNTLNLLMPYFTIKLPRKKTQLYATTFFICYFVIVILFIWAYYSHFRINLDIFAVYEFRMEARAYQMPSFLLYSYSASKAIMPTMMVFQLYSRRKYIAIFLFFIQIISFSIDGSKSVIFGIVLSLIAFFYYEEKMNKWIIWISTGVAGIGVAEGLILKSIIIDSLVIRRMLYAPNLLNYYYYEYFKSNEFDYFKSGFLRRLGFETQYDISLANLIGREYFDSAAMSANNGLFADAYSNLGVAGIVALPILVVFILRVLDSVCNGLETKILVGVIITTTLSLISSSFFTILLTHGFLITCVVLFLLPRPSSDGAEDLSSGGKSERRS